MSKSKRIIILSTVVILVAALLIGGVILLTGSFGNRESVLPKSMNTDWYDESKTEFLITTMEELYGLAELSKTHDFKGQTIKLGADIVINEGSADKWTDKAPKYLWNPIVGFAGTFDGQGHTISGVYGNSIVTSLGLFTDTQKTCVIRNLNLVNSCFKNNNDMGTGSIIGVGGGQLENIYSDAVLVSSGKYVGGLIGCVRAKGENQITNCWFDGTITMDGYNCSSVGGLVGAYTVEDAINTIAHCLSTADISCMGENVGGICGDVGSGAFLNLTDSMFTGTLEYDTNKYAVVGSVIGQVESSASIIVDDTYTVTEIANRTIGTSSGYQKGNAIAVGRDYLVGKGGYQWTTLDFDKYWVVQKDDMPRLGYFTQATESIDGVKKMVDIDWYDPTGATFEITTVQQLYGFAYLSRSYDFRGQTIKLGADITVNEGNASSWANNAPAYNWTPIAWYGSSLSQRFKGTFDGQGHTISGIYAKGTEDVTCIGLFGEVYHGAVVKNFKLVNSYFEGVQDSSVRGPVGSVAGRLRGTIENVYSDAIIVNSAKNTGGIVGMITGTGQNLISSCWFDGKITGITRTGGILGGVYGNKGNIEATIEHCLNTGEINVEIGQAAVGGICGSAETWSILYIDDCLNAGTYRTFGTGKASTHIGTLLGTVTTTDGVGSKAVISHSYGVKDFYSKLVGWKFDTKAVSQSSMMYVTSEEVIGYGGYQWTTLDFENHWAVRTNDCPVPVVFAGTVPSLDGHVRMVDYSWYNPEWSAYTISDFRQLYGMARLWDSTNLFKNKTIFLGADITVNEGNAADWAENAPSFVWEPMKFSGTFNGQGHTISGIYVKGGAEDNYVGFFHRIYQGGTVKNLKLTNSYIEGTMASGVRGAVGSIAGRSNGIIDTVYSDAIVVNSARMTGGLVGMVTGEGENEIRNSWFNGQISGITRTGGILGGMYGNKQNIKVTIENCANTGAIAVPIGYGDVGGICGMAETGGTMYISDCLNAGTYATVGNNKEANTHVGTILGSVTKTDEVSSHVVLDNVYGVNDFYSKLVGWSYGDEGVTKSVAVMMDKATLTAENGYRYAQLDYVNAWGLNTGNVPVPKAFASKVLDAEAISGMVDYSWYEANSDEYIITTPAQLEGFAILCNAENDYFKGKTVKLGADITLNEGNAADWADPEKAPANVWTPLNFNGTFDGQGYTLSGVYVNSTATYTGFFSTVSKGATVKNLKLTNSYIEGNGENTRSGVGSIAGRNHGTIDTVYSNAIVVNSKQMTGGIVGMVTAEGENKITNCWFDGQITGVSRTGGILGGMYGNKQDITATIENCANTGSISVPSKYGDVGGICGMAETGGTLTISNCLNAGTYQTDESEDSNTHIGTIMGSVTQTGEVSSRVVLNNVYGISEFYSKTVGWNWTAKNDAGVITDAGVTKSAAVMLDKATLTAENGYRYAQLDYANAWGLNTGNVPVPKAFATVVPNAEVIKNLVDYSWNTANSDEYIISTPAQLEGFAVLCNAENSYFKDKTVKLGADITLNEGNAADWADPKNAPANVWTPLNFNGTFDGQGYTVSGLYVNSTKQYTGFFSTVSSGATVKNLKLTNSYIEGNGSETRSGVGSIAGRSHGTIDTVYSNAILKNSKQMTGGIVGMVTAEGENKITNCWFDGTINAVGSTGGILGGTYQAAATVEHCLNTGTLSIDKGTAIGGLCGYAQSTGGITILDSLNAGTFVKGVKGEIKQVAAIIGAVHADAALTVKDTYGIKAFSENAIGYSKDNVTGSNYAVRDLADIQGYGAYQWTTLNFEAAEGAAPYWVLKADAIPALSAFDTTDDLAVSGAKDLLDYTWYNDAATSYEIETVEQMYAYYQLRIKEGDDFAEKPVKLTSNEYVITTADQLNAFNSLCNADTDYFAGKTVKLGADITLNEGNAADWADPKNAPANVWTPANFSGIFDGQGHTVSGVYVHETGEYIGFFRTVNSGATVENLKLVNSYIEHYGNAKNNRAGVGSIAGRNHGTIDTVYSNAILKNNKQMTGGIVGMVTEAGENKITNCWFDGQINAINGTGGILGCSYGQTATIAHCLNTGTLNITSGSQVGGLCGYAQGNADVTISDSLNAGKLTAASGVKQIGTITGAIANSAKLTVYNTYGVRDFYQQAVGYRENGELTGSNYAVRDLADIQGYGAYEWTTLDFVNEKHWVLKNEKIPALSAFDTTDVDDLKLENATNLVDYTWYDESKETYVITTAEQLLGFNSLCSDGNDFAGKTVQLGANIPLTLPEGAASNWTPANFSGTFDGQGYTVSGVYVYETGTYVGFFKTVNSGATVKNLKLVDSHIEHYGEAAENHDRAGVGSIAGRNHGTIINVYSNAAIKNNKQMTGGIVGMVTGNGENMISNCWFDGTIDSVSSTGGILGASYGKPATIEHCLNTGKLTVNSGVKIGGLCGYVQGAANVTISDSLNAGELTAAESVTEIGAIVGDVHANGTLTLENTYAVKQFAQAVIGEVVNGTVTGSNYAVRNLTDIQGYGAYQWMKLDFETTPYWVLKNGKIPALSAFDTTDLDLNHAKTLPDYTWYNDAATEYEIETIAQMLAYYKIRQQEGTNFADKPVKLTSDEYILTTAEELLAFAAVCEKNEFAGKTVKLGADITLNEGDASTWGTTPPTNKWPAIGLSGTFDGQDHSISGVYINSTKQYTGFFSTVSSGATVKNLKLTNSYIEGNGSETRSGVGSIAGRNHGTIDTVYSNAIVVNSKQMTGGIVGMVTAEGENKITNCWFDGQIYAVGSTGGILGGAYAKAATIEHCLNTGTITIETGTAIGGLVGFAQSTANVTIRDSLNTGTFAPVEGGTVKQLGTIIGAIHANATLTVNDAYGIKEFSENAIGYKKDDTAVTGGSSNYAVRDLADIKGYGAYQWMKLDFETTPYWVLKNEKIPALSAFDTTDLDLNHAKTLPDYTWYNDAVATYDIATAEQMHAYCLIRDREDFDDSKALNLTGTTYVITTADQLLAFNSLCTADTDYFNGKTILLDADIPLTGGSETTPNWNPPRIKGTFDGQGHSISGVYVISDAQYAGLFNWIDGTVKNLKLIDSYIEGAYTGTESRAGVGSIAGRLYGKIENVYSNATVVNSKQMTGGIVGMGFGGTISNCWFDGTINAVDSTGGILGGTYATTATIEHCLNTGTINVEAGTAIGGLVGYAQNTGGITLLDSLNAGTFVKGNGEIKQLASIIGAVHAKATLTVTDTYGIKEFSAKVIGYSKDNVSGTNYAVRDLADIKGYKAYQWTTLNFVAEGETAPYWVLKNEKIPALSAFDTTDEDDLAVSGAENLPDYTWYNDAVTSYEISTVEQMNAYYQLRKLYEAEGKVFADKDITLSETTYVLDSAEDLMAFAAVCEKNDFTGATVKLGADITLTLAEDATSNWTPLSFSGTFEGNGKTISGLGVTAENAGLFSTVNSGAAVRNLTIAGSSFTGTTASGAVAGINSGAIENVTVTNTVTVNSGAAAGGIAGVGNGGTVTNSQSAATVNGANAGGILGDASGGIVEHCLNTGTVTGSTSAGGLIGNVAGTVTITDSLSAGTVSGGENAVVGAIVGANAGTLTLTNAYGGSDTVTASIGATGEGASVSGSYAVRTLDNIKGYGAYQWMDLNFVAETEGATPYWVLKDGAIPALSAFDTTDDLDVSGAANLPSYTWYHDGVTESYTLTTAQQLHGYAVKSKEDDFTAKTIVLGSDTYTLSTAEQLLVFNSLCTVDTNYFAGKTIQLGADITLNDGEAAAWADPANAPTNKWKSTEFNGTLDGKGHTISGVYVKTANNHNGFFQTINSGATVKNLKLVNSYIEGAKTGSKQRYATGSIAGLNNGTIQDVYSSAIVKNVTGNKMTGGIAGMVNQSETGKIINCWFDGTVYGGEATAGILGGAYNATVYVEHCLNTGTLIVTNGSYYAGGICGDLQNVCNTTITDCLNAGSMTGTVNQSGAIIGRLDKANSTLTLVDSYGNSGFQETLIGKQTGSLTEGSSNSGVKTLDEIKNLTMDAAYWTEREGMIPMLNSFVDFASTLGK